MPNKKINQLDTRTGAALTDLILIGDPTSGTSFKLTATAFRTLLNNVPYTGATTNVNLGAFNLTAASIIRTGGTSSQFLKADGSVDSSTYTPTSRTLTINGTTFDLSADRSWTIAAGITGTGATGQVAYWNGTSSQTGSNNLFWDAANARLGIGTNTPSRKLHVIGTSALFQNAGAFELDLLNTTSGNYLRATAGATDANIGTIQNIPFSFIMNGARVGQFTSTNGNLILQNGGTFTDAGYRLDVQGTVRVTGAATFSSSVTATSFIKSGGTSSQYLMADGSVTTGGGGGVDELQVALLSQVYG